MNHLQQDSESLTFQKCLAPLQKCLVPLQKCLAPLQKCLAPLQKCLAPLQKCLAPLQKCLAPSFGGRLLPASMALVLLAGNLTADDKPEEPPPPVKLETTQVAWAEVIDAVLPGLILDVAPWPGDAGTPSGLAVLLRPEDTADTAAESTHLYRLAGRQGDLKPIATDLPEDLNSLHHHQGQLWLGEEGHIHRFQEGSGLSTLLTLEGLGLKGLTRRGLITDQGILIPEVGRIRQYTANLQPTEDSIEMPVEAKRRANRLQLWSPPMRRLGDNGRLWVSDPETVDGHRFRVTMVDLDASEDERVQTSWLRFADLEDIERSHFVQIDGRPAVIVTTTRGDKLGIFEKLKVRTFLLKPDRTRAGRLPRNQLETVTRNWYQVKPLIVDFDGNGKDDLLLIQPAGLGAGELKIELHVGRGSGLLEPRSRRSKLKGESKGWDMSTDFTHDGTPDLLLVTDGELHVYPGIAKHKKRVIASEPLYRLGTSMLSEASVEISINLSSEGSEAESANIYAHPRLLHLDADTDPEIVLVDELRGRGVVRVVTLK